MRVNEILREYEDEPATKWESWPGNAKEINGEYVKQALADPDHPDHRIFQTVKTNPRTRMFRGMRFPEGNLDSIYYLDPISAPVRTSRGTHNFYTHFMDDISPEWKAFPKRGKSFICSTTVGITRMYGPAFVMVPRRTTQIGVCPTDDIWYSFRRTDLNALVDLFHDMFTAYKIPYPKNTTEFIKASNTVSKLMLADPNRNSRVAVPALEASMIGQARYNPVTMMEHLMNPQDNGFKIVDWPAELPPSVEVWFSEPCYAIPFNLFSTLMGVR